MNEATNKDGLGTRFVLGGLLIISGVAISLSQLGLLPTIDIGRAWPIFLIIIGLARIGATLASRRQHGWALLLVGDWLLLNTMSDWTYVQASLPFLIVGFGALMVYRAMSDRRPAQRVADKSEFKESLNVG
jgi:hypothetical protein